jgi:hypothetical protein
VILWIKNSKNRKRSAGKFGATFEEFRDEVHVFVKAEQIVEALTLLRDEQNLNCSRR